MKVILILVIAAVIASVTLGVEGAAAKAPTKCTGLSGHRWKDVYSKTGTKYSADVRGVTCAFVKPWVARLTRGRPAGTNLIKGGPPGFTCYTQGAYSPTFSFICQDAKTKGRKQTFYVDPQPNK
jgi:hypothetical protein